MRFSGLRKICPGLCAEESFSKGHWLLAFCYNVVKARPPTDDHPGAGTLPSARQTAPLPSFLRQPEASGLPWSYDRLTPPTSGPTLANVDCRPKTQLESKAATEPITNLLLRSRSCVCTTLLLSTTGAFGMRGGPDINLRDL